MRTFRALAAFSLMAGSFFGCGGSDKPGGGGGTTAPGMFDNPDPITSGNSGRGGGGTAGDGLPMGTCANGLVRATRVAPRVVLVLDGSCSMSTNYPANGAQSSQTCTNNPNGRWAALRKALVDPQNGVVAKLQSVVEFGVVVYGTQPKCPIPGEPVTPGLNNLSTIEARMPQVQPGMNTPTGPALDWVYKNLIEQAGPDDRVGTQIVILATDGEPNSCGGSGRSASMTNYQPSIDAVNKGTMKGATTYVISLADATGPFHDHLQELANLGNPAANGKAMLYEPASPAELVKNLETLAGAAVGCDIELNGSIFLDQACDGTVSLNDMPLKCNDPNGWAPIDARNIRLQGSACEAVKKKNDSIVEASFTCKAFRPD